MPSLSGPANVFAQDITGSVPRLARGNGAGECLSFIHLARVGPGNTDADTVLVSPRASLTLSVTSQYGQIKIKSRYAPADAYDISYRLAGFLTCGEFSMDLSID